MPENPINIISVFASIFIAILILIAAYIFGFQPTAPVQNLPLNETPNFQE